MFIVIPALPYSTQFSISVLGGTHRALSDVATFYAAAGIR
jgi:hypothetical protein